MDKDELTGWALANGWQMIAGHPSLTKPSAPKEAIVRLVLKATVAALEVKKPAGKWEKAASLPYARITPDLETGMPLVAIPTTYAGSEVTPVYGLTEAGTKRTGHDPRVLPRTVIYDPTLTVGLPRGLSVTSGLNAIAHAAEGLYARDANPVMSLMAEEGIRALAAGIPAGTMYSYPEAFESEHGRHRQMRMEIDHPNEGKVSNIGFAVKLTGTPQEVRRHPPLLGEHTNEVLKEIGLDSAAIENLTTRGAFAP